MPEGAAMMALYTRKGERQFLPADYKANPVQSRDLTQRMQSMESGHDPKRYAYGFWNTDGS